MSFQINRRTGVTGAWFVVMLSAMLTMGCESNTTPPRQPQETKMNALTVSDLTDGVETLLGTITFDEANQGTLTLEVSGPEADRLQEAWEEMLKRDSLILERHERKEVDGETVTASVAKTVPKGDKQYPDAVWSHLESRYGFLVDRKR